MVAAVGWTVAIAPALCPGSLSAQPQDADAAQNDTFVRQWQEAGQINAPGCRREIQEEICSRFAPAHAKVSVDVVARSGVGTKLLSIEETKPGCALLRVSIGRDHILSSGVGPKYLCQGDAALLYLKVRFTEDPSRAASAASAAASEHEPAK